MKRRKGYNYKKLHNTLKKMCLLTKNVERKQTRVGCVKLIM